MSVHSVSICIPTYEMGGTGLKYLDHSFSKLKEQTINNFEVVISDHSLDDSIKKLCNSWVDQLNIRYYNFKENRGNSSANLNNSIKLAEGDIIKILFQDDFFYDPNSLKNELNVLLNSNSKWAATSCYHTDDGVKFYRLYHPTYNDNVVYGDNTISSPSVIMLFKDSFLQFDENLIWLMDCDFYRRMYDNYGVPALGNTPTVVNRNHPKQITRLIANQELRDKEFKYIKEKYE